MKIRIHLNLKTKQKTRKDQLSASQLHNIPRPFRYWQFCSLSHAEEKENLVEGRTSLRATSSCKSMDAIVTAKCEHLARAATPGLSRAPAYSEQLQKSGQGTCNSRTPQTQPGRFGRHLGENISIYKLLLSLRGLQHLPKFHTEVASDPKFECEHSNFFCWRLLKVTILDFHPQNVLKMLIFLKPTFHCLS